jgi:hypothetical protein
MAWVPVFSPEVLAGSQFLHLQHGVYKAAHCPRETVRRPSKPWLCLPVSILPPTSLLLVDTELSDTTTGRGGVQHRPAAQEP